MEHTYFFRPLHWSAAGTYYDENGTAFPLAGKVQVRRDEDGWTLSGYLEVAFPKPVRFTNDYIIRETGRAGTLAWESDESRARNPARELLRSSESALFPVMFRTTASSAVPKRSGRSMSPPTRT